MSEQNTWPRECVHCKAKVEYNGADLEFSGFGPCKKKPGKHEVESVTYYHAGARDLQDGRDRRRFAPTVILRPAYDRMVDGKHMTTNGLSVQFGDGKLETSDPEIQFHVENKPDVAWGPAGLKMWQDIYLSVEQRNNIAQAENNDLAERNRKLREENTLLEQMKAQKGVKQASA